MPTTKGREKFSDLARECFERQTYPDRELVILKGRDVLGVKRNLAVQLARGDILAHWDDDDWSAPDRLSDQVNRLLASDVGVTGYDQMLFRDEIRRKWWLYSAKRPNYVLGTSLVYHRQAWRQRPFPPLPVGEDNGFIRHRKVATAPAGDLMWARIHQFNSSAKCTEVGINWKPTSAPQWAWRKGYGIVIPSRSDTNLAACIKAIRKSGDRSKIWVVDDGLSNPPDGVTVLPGVKPFIFSRNVNIGVREVWYEGYEGVVVLNDDAEIETPHGFEYLARQRDGITSAAIKRMVGNPRQQPQGVGLRLEAQTLAFICVHIPREVWNRVGEFDERFDEYGGDDNDYCYRTKLEGLKLYIHDGCVVDHGRLPSEFRGHKARNISTAIRQLNEKWGDAWR